MCVCVCVCANANTYHCSGGELHYSAVACVGAFCEYGVCECFSVCLQDRGYRSVSYSIIHVVLAQLYDL
mgnify:CR=1 FL=1